MPTTVKVGVFFIHLNLGCFLKTDRKLEQSRDKNSPELKVSKLLESPACGFTVAPDANFFSIHLFITYSSAKLFFRLASQNNVSPRGTKESKRCPSQGIAHLSVLQVLFDSVMGCLDGNEDRKLA